MKSLRVGDVRVSGQRVGNVLTITRKMGNVPATKRVITVALWAPPGDRYELQQWLLAIVGTIWWDLSDASSLCVTTREVDAMATLIREAWVEWAMETGEARRTQEAATDPYVANLTPAEQQARGLDTGFRAYRLARNQGEASA